MTPSVSFFSTKLYNAASEELFFLHTSEQIYVGIHQNVLPKGSEKLKCI